VPALTGLLGRKKREALEDPVALKAIEETEILESFFMKQPGHKEQGDQLLANYLSCSGLPFGCLERLACINGNPSVENDIPEEQRKVLQIVMEKMLTNVYLPAGTKDKLYKASKATRSCSKYQCPTLDNNRADQPQKFDLSSFTKNLKPVA